MTSLRSRLRRLRLTAWRLAHRGHDRHCPACGQEVSRFAPYGTANRPDAQCPSCGSLERHRALALFLARNPDLDPSRSRVLAVAPDPHLEAIGRRNPDYLSIDVDAGKAMRVMDLTDLPLPDADRDLVIAYHVLEHIPEDRTAMREIARVLRPAGQAIIEVPLAGDATDERYMHADAELRTRHYGQPDHVRLYGRADFEARLRDAGLEPQAIRVGDLLADEVIRASLDVNETFYVVRRAS